MKQNKNDYLIFSLSSSKKLAQQVAEHLKIKASEPELKKFLDGEIYLRLKETVRSKDIFIIQSTSNPVNDNLMELLILVDALKRSSAKTINAIIPYFGYARQDRLNKGREAITSKLVSTILQASGIDRIITFDIHSSQIQGFFDIPTDNIKLLRQIAKQVIDQENIIGNLAILSPDLGSIKRAKEVAQLYGLPIVIVDKRRDKHNDVEIDNIIGEIEGKDILIVDDMIDTGKTIKKTIQIIQNRVKNIYIIATHGVFSIDSELYSNQEEYFNSFEKIGVKKIFVTNSIDQTMNKHKILNVIDISTSIGELIQIIVGEGNYSSITEFIKSQWN